MAAGSIIVDLLLRTGSFITDTDRAAKRLEKFKAETLAAAAGIATGVGAVAAAAAAGAALLERFAGSIANYQDLADKIGDSASSVSRLQLAADQSETSLDAAAAASVKLTVALSKTDEEGSAASRALAALNIPLEEFKRLSPVEQLERVAKEMARYENSTQKTAVAVALFGKTGADLIPFLNDLAESQGRATSLSAEQIEAADKLSKSLATARSQFTQLGRSILSDFLPPLNDGVARVNAALQSFKGLGDILARGVAETLKGNVFLDAADGIDFYAKKLKQLQQNRAVIAADAGQESKGGILKDVDEEIARVDRLLAYYKRIDALARPDLGQTDRRELTRRGRPGQAFGMGEFDPGKPDKPAKATAERASEFDRYVRSLESQLDRTQQLTAQEQVLLDIQRGRLGQVGVLQQDVLLSYAQELDSLAALAKENKAEEDRLKARAEEQATLTAQAQRFYEATRTPQEQLNEALAEQERLLQRLGPQYEETYGRATEALRKQAEGLDRAKVRAQQYAEAMALTVTGAFEEAIFSGQKLGKVLESLALDLLRLTIRKQLEQDAFPTLVKFFGGGNATGGDVIAGREYLVGESGPERFVPRTAGTIVPSSRTGGGPTVNQYLTVGDGVNRAQFVAALSLLRQQIKAEMSDEAFRSRKGGAA